MSFSTLGLRPTLLRAVTDAGYTEPTPIQQAAIPHALAGRDLIGIAQTGTGKTAAFVLPLLEMLASQPPHVRRTPRALVLAPTRELAAQIDESIATLSRHLPFRRVAIFGGVGEQPQIDALRRGVDIIVATPGRLLDLMQSRHVDLRDIRYAVLDEADRMLDMGFLPQIRRVVGALPKDRQTLLFSATLSNEIEQVTSAFLQNPETVEIGRRSNPADTVAQALYPVPKSRKVELLLALLQHDALDSVLVFSRTKHGADKIARKLKQAGIETAALHSNRSQGQRVAALKAFKSGNVRVLVATDIAARGIDVEGISHVINFDFPMHAEDYVHRIGRTGRAQAIGDAISFVTNDDAPYVRDVEKLTRRPIPRKQLEGFDYTDRAPAPQPMMPRTQSRSQSHPQARTQQRPPQHRNHPAPHARSAQAPPAPAPRAQRGRTRP
ncbi:MAG: DEAD/DEAH box helicase [Acidobacteria bacterium]|nr:DEAD/DEAH box helicase [Acidobacteriota bacterium]MBV9476356.1 DEAD/DEAH box helicase [Acidobacteriota bacterium]